MTDGGAKEVNFVGNLYKPGPASELTYALQATVSFLLRYPPLPSSRRPLLTRTLYSMRITSPASSSTTVLATRCPATLTRTRFSSPKVTAPARPPILPAMRLLVSTQPRPTSHSSTSRKCLSRSQFALISTTDKRHVASSPPSSKNKPLPKPTSVSSPTQAPANPSSTSTTHASSKKPSTALPPTRAPSPAKRV